MIVIYICWKNATIYGMRAVEYTVILSCVFDVMCTVSHVIIFYLYSTAKSVSTHELIQNVA